MAALHAALQALGPTSFSDVPSSSPDDANYLQDLFLKAQLIVESVPPPPEDPIAPARDRSNTAVSEASNASEISTSSYRSAPAAPEHAALQKEWSKPIKLAPKDNPLNIPVYKLNGKDGRGAWFARRSVHEGMGFAKWKKGLEMEFPETMEVQGPPGQGNIRGIGGERRVERKVVKGVGKLEVYHLSAQFPGPTTPRDFVTLLITSSVAMKDSERNPLGPRHYMIVSKPCNHHQTPVREGYIRGQYESIEFIREIPIRPKKPSTNVDLPSHAGRRDHSPGLKKSPITKNPEQRAQTFPLHHDNRSEGDVLSHDQLHLDTPDGPTSDSGAPSPTRRRSKTLSYAESRGREAKGEDIDNPHAGDEAESNPVEWIMITRSDPGGSVPRFMVERGTPGSIVADAVKFLNWATQKKYPDIPEEEGEGGEDRVDQIQRQRSVESRHFHEYEANGHLAGLAGQELAREVEDEKAMAAMNNEKNIAISNSEEQRQLESSVSQLPETVPDTLIQSGILASVAQAVAQGIEMYAPQSVLEYLPGHSHQNSLAQSQFQRDPEPDRGVDPTRLGDEPDNASISSASSAGSFASADSHLFETPSVASKSPSSQSNQLPSALSPHEKELAKLIQRKQRLDEKLARTRDRETKSAVSQTEKEKEALYRAEKKHAKEVQRQEERYRREVEKLNVKKIKEAKKMEEKMRKLAEKDEKMKLTRENQELRAELEVLRKEKDIWLKQVRELQRENTMLTARIGRLTAVGTMGGTGSGSSASDGDVPDGGNTGVGGALAGTTAAVGGLPAAAGMGGSSSPGDARGRKDGESVGTAKKDFMKDLKDVGGRVRGLTLESLGGASSRSGSVRRKREKDTSTEEPRSTNSSPGGERTKSGNEADRESMAS